MNDRSHFEAILNSPGSLFQELGLEKIYLYREDGLYSGTVPVFLLDDNIRNRGRARIWRGFTSSGEVVPIRLKSNGGDMYQCLLLAFDYTLGKFYFGFCKNASVKIISRSVEDVWQLGVVLKPTHKSIVLPPV
ncbi:MAG: hypothetical protein WCG73_01680 [Candidatus Moraniibacteriota bacterium]